MRQPTRFTRSVPSEIRRADAGIGLAALAIAVLLAGCAGTSDTGPADGAGEVVWGGLEAVIEAPPGRKVPPPPRKKPAVPGTTIAAKPAGGDLLPVPPEQVIGLTQTEMVELLGPPAEQEDRAPAKVWHYAGRSCSVSVIFYPEVESLTWRALNLEIEERGNRPASEPVCLGEIAAATRKPDA